MFKIGCSPSTPPWVKITMFLVFQGLKIDSLLFHTLMTWKSYMFVKNWKYVGKTWKLMITWNHQTSFKSILIQTHGYLKRKPLQSNDKPKVCMVEPKCVT
jgi:hypothetical protein